MPPATTFHLLVTKCLILGRVQYSRLFGLTRAAGCQYHPARLGSRAMPAQVEFPE